ncbi:MAG: endonuclease/exonuclease/phosphatase family protein [Acidimicrobiia bacterium]
MIFVAVPALLLSLASVAAFFGRWMWWLDVLANFRSQYLVGLIVLGVVLAASRRWRRWGYVSLLVAAMNLVLVLPLYLGSPVVDPALPDLRVLNFNLLSSNESFGDVIEYIETVDADLVVLHEASRPWEVAIDAADLGYQVIRARSEELIFGTLILVRGANLSAVSYGFASESPRAVELVFVPNGWEAPVRALITHPLAPTDRERAALRDAQLSFAANWAADQEAPFFVVGDLNATPWSWAFRRLKGSGGLRNSQEGFGLQASFPATASRLLRVPIDHLLYSDGLGVRERLLGPALGSDHFPLIVDLVRLR